ncbi:hypothetical protein TJA_08230 [Thermus sp. LT1-2-5]
MEFPPHLVRVAEELGQEEAQAEGEEQGREAVGQNPKAPGFEPGQDQGHSASPHDRCEPTRVEKACAHTPYLPIGGGGMSTLPEILHRAPDALPKAHLGLPAVGHEL